MINNNNNNNKEEEKEKEEEEDEEEDSCGRTGGHTDQTKEVQEVLADLKKRWKLT